MPFLFSRGRGIDVKSLRVVYGQSRLDEQGGEVRGVVDFRVNTDWVDR